MEDVDLSLAVDRLLREHSPADILSCLRHHLIDLAEESGNKHWHCVADHCHQAQHLAERAEGLR